MKKKIMTAAFFVAVILVVGAVIYFYPRTTGSELLKLLQWDNIETVTIEKTLENSKGITTVATYELTAEELSSFCELFNITKLKNVYGSSISILSETRYYIIFRDERGNEECWMQFYHDDLLIFDYLSREQPTEIQRYKITETALISFFEEILAK